MMKSIEQIKQELVNVPLSMAEHFEHRDLSSWQFLKGWQAALRWVLDKE